MSILTRVSGDIITILIRAQAFPASNKVRGLHARRRFPVTSNPMQAEVERRVILRSASRPAGSRFIFFCDSDVTVHGVARFLGVGPCITTMCDCKTCPTSSFASHFRSYRMSA